MPLNPFSLAALLLLCAALGLRLYQRRNAWRDADVLWPFYAKKPLASPEQLLYQRLVMALPGHMVLCRVPLSGVLGVKRGFDFERWSQRLRRLQYDFVVCARDATVLGAIDLIDQTRDATGSTPSDAAKQRASAAAGVRLMRWQAKALPDLAAIQAAFGEPELTLAAGPEASANQSWWPPLPSTGRTAPAP